MTPTCRRCGRCCEQGGPALHREDLALVESGVLPLESLFTIRRGETVRDNVRGTLETAVEEIVKVRGSGGRWRCTFYDAPRRRCGVYANRPLECRLLQCADPEPLAAVYRRGRLRRRDVLDGLPELLELAEDHDRRCGYERMADRVARAAEGGQGSPEAAAIREAVAYDRHLRAVLTERGGMKPERLDFLLGRPLTETLSGFDLTVRVRGDRVVLTPAPLS